MSSMDNNNSKPIITEIINTKQLAEVLKSSPQTIKRLVQQGKIPAFKLGTRYRFDLSEVLEALENQK